MKTPQKVEQLTVMNADLYKIHDLPNIPQELTDLVTQYEPDDSEWIMHRFTNRSDLLEKYRKLLKWYDVPREISDYMFDIEFFRNHPDRDKLGCFYHIVFPDCNGIHTDGLRTYAYNFVIDNGMPDNSAVPVATYDNDQNLVTQIETYQGTWYYLNGTKNHRVWDHIQPRKIITMCDLPTMEDIKKYHLISE